jgi:hypothetical protein
MQPRVATLHRPLITLRLHHHEYNIIQHRKYFCFDESLIVQKADPSLLYTAQLSASRFIDAEFETLKHCHRLHYDIYVHVAIIN